MKIEWLIQETAWPRELPDAVSAFLRDGPAAWLDSAAPTQMDELHVNSESENRKTHNGYSLICRAPIGILEQPADGGARFLIDNRCAASDANGWALWKAIQHRLPKQPQIDLHIVPGWIGHVGFEMGHFLERLPKTNPYDLGLSLMRMMLFDRGIVLDHARQRAFAIAATGARSSFDLPEEPIEHLLEQWQAAATVSARPAYTTTPTVSFDMPREYYRGMIHRALEYIAAGDIYQVNLAQRLRCDGVGNPFETYCRMRQANPAAYAAYLQGPDGTLGSVSPELFLKLRGRDVLTSPIKGTRPHTGDTLLDAAYRQELLDSEKEAAELAMIIDLHRNDLGKVCDYGSVLVRAARRIETHPTVYHTVADVIGRLRPEYNGLDLLQACFPAGSISGVPKIRAQEIIDELEPAARGAYTGTIGVLGLDGGMTFSVAIRTVQFRDDTAFIYVGGGIVADSDPEDEYEETLAKARGMLNGIMGETAIPDDVTSSEIRSSISQPDHDPNESR